MSKITLQPTASQVLIRPDVAYEEAESVHVVNGQSIKTYKASKSSLIELPKEVVEKKDKAYLVGTVIAACDTAGVDFPSGIRHATYTPGMRVVYVGAHVSIVRFKTEIWHLIPGEFIKGIVHE